ncbi:MAG: type II secretion system protein [Proteobacteria bacterium]|nr:type II secretion system protein [Pseudomonadota bacterium]MDA1309249.1 type II secretion system protein [Pseudomonadota bacterium]
MTRRRQAGFTLLEVLVALVIVALAITAALQSSSLSINAATKSSDATRAALQARSLLAEFGVSRELKVGALSGHLAPNATWTAHITERPSPTPLLQAYEIVLGVTFGASRVVLQTLRLTPTGAVPSRNTP